MTFGFPLAIMYSALISSSWSVALIPLLSRMGFFVIDPTSLRRSKFCMFLAPIWITSTSLNSGRCSMLMSSVTMGSPVSLFASRSMSRPRLPRPWNE